MNWAELTTVLGQVAISATAIVGGVSWLWSKWKEAQAADRLEREIAKRDVEVAREADKGELLRELGAIKTQTTATNATVARHEERLNTNDSRLAFLEGVRAGIQSVEGHIPRDVGG